MVLLFSVLKRCVIFGVIITLLLSACVSEQKSGIDLNLESTQTPTAVNNGSPTSSRPQYLPGTLVDYIAQNGDTLPALAAHFNSTEKEIRQANPSIPPNATTMPPGFPMKIPIYYLPLWGNPFHIIPDSLFVNGPSQIGFSARDFVNSQPGWFKNYQDNAAGDLETGGDLIDHISDNFSISPRLLLAVLEYQTGALTQSKMPDFNANPYPLGYQNPSHKGLYAQLVWAANVLNNGYYGWRAGYLTLFERKDKTDERPDPWLNAGSVGLHYYLSQVLSPDDYNKAISEKGITLTYEKLFGNPWENVQNQIPGSLVQPAFQFPFEPFKIWALTGGPHAGWGDGQPFAALDFAPPSEETGCAPSLEWVTAVADGVVIRSSDFQLMLDLDGDGDERTGWVVFYLHLAGMDTPPVGTHLKAGDRIGHPSCNGGEATGTHVHVARKYNGEWILAGGPVSFNMDGWMAKDGDKVYLGYLVKNSDVIKACVCSDKESHVSYGPPLIVSPP